MKNYKKKLELLQQEEERYILEKALEYQKELGIENTSGGWNDTTDGFRHAWGSAYLAMKYGDLLSQAATSGHELLETYQPKEEKAMDEWNNAIGREIAKNIKSEYKDIDKNINWSSIEDLIAQKALEKISQNEIATSTSDPKLNNPLFKLTAVKNATENTTESLKDRLIRMREEKLAKYTQRLAESPQKIQEKESKHVTLEELKAPQEAKKKRVKDIINGTVEFDENIDLSAYENKKNNDNKIFTKEDIEEMSDEEREKNKDAIAYQKRTIGVPTREQADKAVKSGGMVHVASYTRSDGTKVKSYYRSR